MHDQGDITLVRCKKCGESFPIFTFSSDTDMITIGCAELTGTVKKDIVITTQLSGESDAQLQERVGHGYKVVSVAFEQQRPNSSAGSDFKGFLKNYLPLKPVYNCVYCGDKTEIIGHESKEEFALHGKLRVL